MCGKYSVEHQLEHQQVLRFLKDSFPDGVAHIRASSLYERYKNWGEEEDCGVCKNAKFGKEVKKVQGMQGLSNNFNFKKEKDITNKEKESSSIQKTLHPSLMTVTEQVDEAWGERI